MRGTYGSDGRSTCTEQRNTRERQWMTKRSTITDGGCHFSGAQVRWNAAAGAPSCTERSFNGYSIPRSFAEIAVSVSQLMVGGR